MKDSQAIQAYISELEDTRYRAMMDGNFDSFEALAHPELTYTHSTGVVDTLGSYLAKCRDGYYDYIHIDHPIESVDVVGDIALVHGLMTGELVAGGVHKRLRNRSLAIWRRVGEQWLFYTYQPTPIK